MSPDVEPSGDASRLPLAETDIPALVSRIHRASGQLDAVARMLGEGKGCAEVIPQFVAARRALDKVAFKVIESALRMCLTDPEASAQDRARLERLFLSLS
ncbi:MAG: metal-sensitive transcriptional regulator [Tetrasphaera sp.]|jgi:DNA-binding FrmR family transcriptional regulator|nr:metal-sensitive transcriptional regulator [Tetrasphaera sp.]